MPSGIWAAEEYAKLPRYDQPTYNQPDLVFLCHQVDGRVCAGWAGCHDGGESLGLRMAVARGDMDTETVIATRDYISPVPLFGSGAEAAAHGLADLPTPGRRAVILAARIERKRSRQVAGLEARQRGGS